MIGRFRKIGRMRSRRLVRRPWFSPYGLRRSSSPELITLLTQKGRKRGLPYQTMLKVILKENIDRY